MLATMSTVAAPCSSLLRALLVAALGFAALPAQCALQWAGFGSGMNNDVRGVAVAPNGDVFAGGSFTSAGGVAANRIARWDGATWHPLGNGMNGTVEHLIVRANGDVIACGWFSTAGSSTVNYIARWDGSQWHALGSGMSAQVLCVAELANGDLVACGSFSTAGGAPAPGAIARWDGTNWSALASGVSGFSSGVRTVVRYGLGFVAGGYFTAIDGQPANNIATWLNGTWSPLGAGVDGAVRSIVVAGDDIIAGGEFANAGGSAFPSVARWDGANWSGFGAGPGTFSYALGQTADGDLITSGPGADNAKRWDGSQWASIGFNTLPTNGAHVIRRMPSGDVLFGGFMVDGVGTGSPHVVRWTTNCLAEATSFAAGCSGAGGANTLTATSLPWTGANFEATATGLASPSLVLVVTGFSSLSPALPLAVAFPIAGAGCDLHVAPDVLDVALAVGGTMETGFPIPASPALAGTQLFHQLVPIELDASLNFVEVTSTNALQLTIGTF